MSRRSHWMLIAGCVLVGGLELPAALRSLGETWRGPYALDASAHVQSANAPSSHSTVPHTESTSAAGVDGDALASPADPLPRISGI